MHVFFLEFLQKERRLEQILYPLLLVLILFVCNCYSESLYGYIGVQNVLILQLFLFFCNYFCVAKKPGKSMPGSSDF